MRHQFIEAVVVVGIALFVGGVGALGTGCVEPPVASNATPSAPGSSASNVPPARNLTAAEQGANLPAPFNPDQPATNRSEVSRPPDPRIYDEIASKLVTLFEDFGETLTRRGYKTLELPRVRYASMQVDDNGRTWISRQVVDRRAEFVTDIGDSAGRADCR